MLGPRNQAKDSRNFINVAVSKATRAGLHLLKEAMGVQGQAEVIAKLVTIGMAFTSPRAEHKRVTRPGRVFVGLVSGRQPPVRTTEVPSQNPT